MPRTILYFTEYIYKSEDGEQYSPYMEGGKWYLPGFQDNPVTLTDVGRLCNIGEQELNFLKLKYGDRYDSMG